MNNAVKIKATFIGKKKDNSGMGNPKLPKDAVVPLNHMNAIKSQIKRLSTFWANNSIIGDNVLVDVYYNVTIAKSRRADKILNHKETKYLNDCVVGARFTSENDPKHIITYRITKKDLAVSVEKIEKCTEIIATHIGEQVNEQSLAQIIRRGKKNDKIFKTAGIARSDFNRIIVDAFFIKSIKTPQSSWATRESNIVTCYDTGEEIDKVLERAGITVEAGDIIDRNTIVLNNDKLRALIKEAPYLISMSAEEFIEEITEHKTKTNFPPVTKIPSPKSEPTVGVIDTMFDENVYFADWVKFKNMLPTGIEIDSNDKLHGTAVSSIIVDGPALNPGLDDGCGRFRVRHFGVAKYRDVSIATLARLTRRIVSDNKDIHVWNLSLGSNSEIDDNSISYMGAVLDEIQSENDVVFVVSGTNIPKGKKGPMKIGSPADSINSIVVNSVDKAGSPATYSRKGGVLSFFNKPDIAYYGGDKDELIRVREPLSETYVDGTSFAAPWISRKLAYLIEVVGFSREVAKAMLIDSAMKWSGNLEDKKLIGHGVIPIHVEDIIKSQDDEIKLVFDGISEKYNTFFYNLPVPMSKGKYPYIAKATMCYFPSCSRNQGVDYTDIELDFKFGRMKKNGQIDSINDDKQFEDGFYTYEKNARANFRKWDNVKHLIQMFKRTLRDKQPLAGGWGIDIKMSSRLESKKANGVKFGIVVTLKEIHGVNRYEKFLQMCNFAHVLAEEIKVDEMVEINAIMEHDVIFEDDER